MAAVGTMRAKIPAELDLNRILARDRGVGGSWTEGVLLVRASIRTEWDRI